jgi:hypothetical protein
MKAKQRSKWAGWGFAVLAVAGFLVPFWPLAGLGVALAGATGRLALALCLGLVLDIAWGTPGGLLGAVAFPFTLLGLACFGLLKAGERYLFPQSTSKTLY